MSVPIRWGGMDPFTHMLVVGPTRCGKTATVLKPLIYQLLLLKARGVPLGLSVIEPKGDVAAMVAELCEEMGLDYTHIDPTVENTGKFNPMEGDIDTVAEATVVVLKGLFGKQDAFFATVQELSARNVTKLLKELHGDGMDIIDVMNTLRDENVLADKVAELKKREGMTDLVHFFESELLGSMKEKYRQFVIGLRAQLENVVSNKALRNIMTGKSSFSIDEHYEKGGVLAVNTALGMLRTSGDAFGQFIMMHLQSGAFRRGGTESTRIPHFLIVDETSRYINPDIEIFLNLAAEYRVAGIFAIQSLGQLELESGRLSAKAVKRAILGGCRNLVVFGGVKSEDARDLAEEFGKDKILMRQSTYKNNILLPNLFPDSYRDTEETEYRFDATDLMDGLPRFYFVHKLLQDGHPQKPGVGRGMFMPRNWKELREWENHKKKKKKKLSEVISYKFVSKRKKGKGVQTDQEQLRVATSVALEQQLEQDSEQFEENVAYYDCYEQQNQQSQENMPYQNLDSPSHAQNANDFVDIVDSREEYVDKGVNKNAKNNNYQERPKEQPIGRTQPYTQQMEQGARGSVSDSQANQIIANPSQNKTSNTKEKANLPKERLRSVELTTNHTQNKKNISNEKLTLNSKDKFWD